MADADTGSEVYHAVGDFATDEEGKVGRLTAHYKTLFNRSVRVSSRCVT